MVNQRETTLSAIIKQKIMTSPRIKESPKNFKNESTSTSELWLLWNYYNDIRKLPFKSNYKWKYLRQFIQYLSGNIYTQIVTALKQLQ